MNIWVGNYLIKQGNIMKTLNKIKDWFLNLEIIKTLNYRNVWITPIFTILSTVGFYLLTKSNESGIILILSPLLITLYLFKFSANESGLVGFFKEHLSVVLTLIVVTAFQMLSVWAYNEPKMMFPESVQSIVIIALPAFKWFVFIHVLTISRINNKDIQGESNV